MSCCTKNAEPVSTLSAAVLALLKTFKFRNGVMPKRIIVYRDGVADNQFEDVIHKELPAFKGAIEELGYPADSVAIAVVVIQKRHHTRLVYQSKDSAEFHNPCAGLCVDGRSSTDAPELSSINSNSSVDFYLNSHAAVLGTSKPARYSIIYDEIHFTVSTMDKISIFIKTS